MANKNEYTVQDYLNFIHWGRYDKVSPKAMKAILDYVLELEKDCVDAREEADSLRAEVEKLRPEDRKTIHELYEELP